MAAGAPREIVEERLVACCRPMPTPQQRLGEAVADVQRQEAVVAAHPG
jgi:hypothetical protein